jgi:Domain of unknown function (DUF4177)
MPERYEYRVVEVRESRIGGKMSGGKLEKLLNEHASQGWQLKAITSADVKGRVGPGGTEGLLVTFERRIGAITSPRAVPSVHPQVGGNSIEPVVADSNL